MLTLTQAIQELGVSRSTMYRLIKSGKIKPIRYSDKGIYRFDPSSLNQLKTKQALN